MMALFNLGGGEILLLLFSIFFIPLGLLATAFWIWMLIDCIKNENITGNEKIAWVLVIALTHLLGAIIYFFAGRKRQKPIQANV
jgi:hypothetical protein